VLSLQPAVTGSDGISPEERVLATAAQLNEALPEALDLGQLKFKMRDSSDPLQVVLVQEIGRYNVLLEEIKTSLFSLERALKGLELITPELERMQQSFTENKVPERWSFAYFSLKPLGSWIKDLCERYEFFTEWVKQGSHFVYWLSAFTYPTAFTTSLQQKYSRKKDMPSIDKLEFEFVPQKDRPIQDYLEGAKDGAFIRGLYLEGAKWDEEKTQLCEPEVMELFVELPVILFKPILKRSKALPNNYECPVYYYPIRKATVDRESFMFYIDLKMGPDHTQDFWVKRGTAVLLSVAV